MSEKAVWVPRQKKRWDEGLNLSGADLTDKQKKAVTAARKARAGEKNRRAIEARRRAHMLLADRYPKEFHSLLVDMTDQINEECGDLPVVDIDAIVRGETP